MGRVFSRRLPRRRSVATALAAAAALPAAALVAACGDELVGEGAEQATPVLAAAQPLETADGTAKTQRPTEPALLAVSGVRVDTHEGFDRVVLDLAGDGDPGWFMDYTATPMQATVGKPLTVSGNAFLNVNVDGTTHPAELGLDSHVPVSVAGSTGNVVDVAVGGTSEGRSQIVVGLRSEAPYSVQLLQDPKRLVVDIVQS